MIHSKNTSIAIIGNNDNPNAMPTLQTNHGFTKCKTIDGTKEWKFLPNNVAGSKWEYNLIGISDLKPELKSTVQLQPTDTEIDIKEGVAFNIPKLTADKTLTFANEVENKMIKLIINLNSHALTLPANVNIDDLILNGGDVWEVIQIEATMMNGVLQHKAQKLM